MATNSVTFTYRNWRGEIRERTVTPIDISFCANPHHDGPQWFLNATDDERGVRRSFAIQDILSPIRHVAVVNNAPSRAYAARDE
jgi:predicted DNA-binding transcriptional regulator YafY